MAPFFLTACLLGVILHAGAAASLRSVDVSGTDVGDCASSPCFSLSYAIAQAVTGDVVELGPGNHSGPLNRNLELGGGKAALTIRGGAGTIVDLQNKGRFIKLDASAGATTIQALTILNGNCVDLGAGNRKGAGIMLVNSTAILINLTLSHMFCASIEVKYGDKGCEFCGGAFYMEDSSARLSNLLVTDCVANHGSGMGMWGNEASVVEDSVFERHVGTQWGGTVLTEGNVTAEFRRIRFSYGTSDAGGHLDDGGTSAPTFTDCIFEYGVGLQGSTYYSYGSTRTRFENCVFQHSYATKSAAVYINGDTLPAFINVTFYNNTARIEAGAVRSFTVGENGPLVFNRSRFIQNSVASTGKAGTVEVSGNAIFDSCVFEDNLGGLQGGAIVNSGAYGAGLPLVISNSVFKGNKADVGSAILMWTIQQEEDKVPLVTISDTVFEGNYATNSGTVRLEGPHKVTISKSVFRANVAGLDGGGVSVSGQGNAAAELLVVDTEFALNYASGDGGAISCVEPFLKSSKLDLLRATFGNNSAAGVGGAVASSCTYPNFSHSVFLGNEATTTNGGALALGQVDCTAVGEPIFVEVQLLENDASQVGGAVFYLDPVATSCAIPTVQGDRSSWNSSAGGGWKWSNFATQVTGNKASAGNLQATMPVQLLVACSDVEDKTYSCRKKDGNLSVDGFPGVMVNLNVSMIDGIGQVFKDDTATIQLSMKGADFSLTGVKRYRFDAGYASADSAQLIVDGVYKGKVQGVACVSVQLPKSMYPNVAAVQVNVTMPDSDAACPVGWTPMVWSPTGPLAAGPPAAGPPAAGSPLMPSKNANWKCVACPSGNYAELGALSCSACPLGTYAGASGSASCDVCPPGYSCPAGTSLPAICFPGSARDPNATGCELCPEGTYQPNNASSSCLSCEDYLLGSTCQRGSALATECHCPMNTLSMAARCVKCPDGLSSDGSSTAMQQAGYWAEQTQSRLLQVALPSAAALGGPMLKFDVLRCRDTDQCPAGPLGTCAFGRTGMACNDCMSGFYEADSGTCQPCTGAITWPLVVGIIVCCILAALLFAAIKADISKQSLAIFTVAAVGGQAANAIQALSAIQQINVSWPYPISSVLDVYALIVFDYRVIHTSCIWQVDSSLARFLEKVFTYPIAALMIALTVFISRLVKRPLSLNSALNANGMLLFLFYITLTLAVLLPFQCAPTPNGGKSSMLSDPGVICFESDEHVRLVILSVIGIAVYPVGIAAWLVWVTLSFPNLISSGRGIQVLQRYRFLFGRYKPECYYFGAITLGRNALVALVPVVLVTVPGLEILIMGGVMLGSAVLPARLWPWRTDLASICDVAIYSILVVLLLATGPLITPNESDNLVLPILMCVLALSVIFAVVVATTIAMLQRHRQRNLYGAFLCHHKGGAGVLARFIKMAAAAHTNDQMFLDSDNLEDLDTLFNIVRSETKNVIVIMTPEVLKRIWCAGEIATAFNNGIHILPVICDDLEMPSERDFESILELWTQEQLYTVGALGITVESIMDSYRHLRTLPFVSMPRFGNITEQGNVVIDIVHRLGLPKRIFSEMAGHTDLAKILILGNVTDAEGLATCHVVQKLVQRELQLEATVIQTVQQALSAREHASCMLVVLSGTMLRDSTFASILMTLQNGATFMQNMSSLASGTDSGCDSRDSLGEKRRKLSFVTVNADPRFFFPDEKFYGELADEGLPPHLEPEDGLVLVTCYRSLLKTIALPLMAHGSQTLINMQMHEVCRRVQKSLSEQFDGGLRKRRISWTANDGVKASSSLRSSTAAEHGHERDNTEMVFVTM